MKIREFLQDIIDRYSFHYVAWIGPAITFLILFLIYIIFCFLAIIWGGGSSGDALASGMIFIVFPVVLPVIIPCYAFLYALIFLTLWHNEKINLKFRLKQNAFTRNIIIQLLFILLIILGLGFYLFILWIIFKIFSLLDDSRILAFGFGIPLAILILAIHSVVLKFFHIESPINWD